MTDRALSPSQATAIQPVEGLVVPDSVAELGDAAAWRYVEFFTLHVRNTNTRRAYARACARFMRWCSDHKLELLSISSFHVAAYIDELGREVSAPSVNQQLAAIRMICDWLVIGRVIPNNPASAVRGPKHVVKTGKTPVLEGDEWRRLVDSIPDNDVRGLRDRALIATLTYSFARIGAALAMRVKDLRPEDAGWTLRLHEKGGKHHVVPAHHALADALNIYLQAGGIREDRKGWIFRTTLRHDRGLLSERPLGQTDAWRIIRRRALAAGITTPVGNHSLRATGISAFLLNGGALGHAQIMAAHESPRTTKLYDRSKDRLTQDDIEKIRL